MLLALQQVVHESGPLLFTVSLCAVASLDSYSTSLAPVIIIALLMIASIHNCVSTNPSEPRPTEVNEESHGPNNKNRSSREFPHHGPNPTICSPVERASIRKASRTTQAAIRSIRVLQSAQRKQNNAVSESGAPKHFLPLVYQVRQAWQRINLKNDFKLLDNAVQSLARSLQRHVAGNPLVRDHLHSLSKRHCLIEGAPDELWHRKGELMFQGSIWSILLETIFSDELAVFGESGQHLAQEWTSPNIQQHSTAIELLTRSGILQYSGIFYKRPTDSLKDLLQNRHSISTSKAEITRFLMLASKTGRRSLSLGGRQATARAAAILRNTDERARRSIHEARTEFTRHLDELTYPLGAQRACSAGVERVVTQAQVLAIQWAAHIHGHALIYPKNREMFGHALSRETQHGLQRELSCRHGSNGPIVFTVRPGFRKVENADSHQMEVLQPAIVYLAYTDDEMAKEPAFSNPFQPSPLSNSAPRPAPEESTDRPSSAKFPAQHAHIPVATSNKNSQKLLETFEQLNDDILQLVKSLQLIPGKDRPNVMRPYTLLGQETQFPLWNDFTKYWNLTRSAIWRVLLENLFHHPFAVYGDSGKKLRTEWEGLKQTNAKGEISHPANRQRQNLCRFIFETALGGEALFVAPQNSRVKDRQLESDMTIVMARLRSAIISLLRIICVKLPQGVLIDKVVERATLLAIHISIHDSHIKPWVPALHTSWAQPKFAEEPWLDVEHFSKKKASGRLAFVIQPGLKFFFDANETELLPGNPFARPLGYIENGEGIGFPDLSAPLARPVESKERPINHKYQPTVEDYPESPLILKHQNFVEDWLKSPTEGKYRATVEDYPESPTVQRRPKLADNDPVILEDDSDETM
ncbi:hypothetical protein P280DRAFT_267671 [Massarina eburnea CBS 473.64]|uniref:Uncharacterized protein n=1 Tax=Massarina eburnea CBS 473.64 TaxID=1395130 RepID=A0A6A6S718_9PLEO|nr:hypothetical protein P280DRAFT_267671 [Massarina eburnea CBS 473.64]